MKTMRLGKAILLAALIVSALLELSFGPMNIPILEIPGDFIHYLQGNSSLNEVVIGAVRMPSVITAVFVGGGLATSGAVLQAMLKNSMADPSIIGVSSGGSLGAVIAISSGFATGNLLVVPAVSFLFGILVVFLIYRLSTTASHTNVYSMLLSGVAITSFCGAIIALIMSLSPTPKMAEMLFWIMGGLDGITWSQCLLVVVFVAIGVFIYFFHAKHLDALSVGEEHAASVGVNVQMTKRIALICCAFVVGACVGTTGVIGFIGLIVPHMMRLLFGGLHRNLLFTSFIGGAVLLLLSDLVARMAFLPAEINVGVVTSCLGAPFFLYLLRKQRGDLL